MSENQPITTKIDSQRLDQLHYQMSNLFFREQSAEDFGFPVAESLAIEWEEFAGNNPDVADRIRQFKQAKDKATEFVDTQVDGKKRLLESQSHFREITRPDSLDRQVLGLVHLYRTQITDLAQQILPDPEEEARSMKKEMGLVDEGDKLSRPIFTYILNGSLSLSTDEYSFYMPLMRRYVQEFGDEKVATD